MKALILTLFITLSFVFAGNSQSIKNEFEVKPKVDEISINSGSEANFDIEILRSKRYSKTNIELMADMPEGFSMSFDPKKTKETEAKATLKIGANVAAGSYVIVVKGVGNNTSKGRMLTVFVK